MNKTDWIDKVCCGNCIELMSQMPEGCVDLVVTSPPYDDLRNYDSEQSQFDVAAVVQGLYRIMKKGGIVVWVTADKTQKGSETLTSFNHAIAFKSIGFNIHDTMIYAKDNPIPLNHNRYEQQFEYMFIFSKGKPKTFNPILVPVTTVCSIKRDEHHTKNYNRGNTRRGHNSHKIKNNIWFYKIGYGCSTKDKEAFDHPAIFPEQLAEDHIQSWTNPGDLVFDPMCGSGTTLKAAVKMKRHYLGFDVSEKYVNLSRTRLSI